MSDTAIINGGGGGTEARADLTNYYTKSETEALFTPYYTRTSETDTSINTITILKSEDKYIIRMTKLEC